MVLTRQDEHRDPSDISSDLTLYYSNWNRICHAQRLRNKSKHHTEIHLSTLFPHSFPPDISCSAIFCAYLQLVLTGAIYLFMFVDLKRSFYNYLQEVTTQSLCPGCQSSLQPLCSLWLLFSGLPGCQKHLHIRHGSSTIIWVKSSLSSTRLSSVTIYPFHITAQCRKAFPLLGLNKLHHFGSHLMISFLNIH